MVASFKPIVDGLIHAKIIADDSWKMVGAWTVDQKFRPRKEGQLITIKVEEDVLL